MSVEVEEEQIVSDTMPAAEGRLDALQRQLDAAKASRAEEESRLSDDDREEIELRRQIASEREKAKEAELERRQLDLERRLDVAREKYDLVAGLVIDEYPDTFILRPAQQAYSQWSEAIAKAANSKKKVDREAASRRFAVASVIDWNGKDLSSPTGSDHGLVAYLKKRPGIATSIVNEAATLTGAFNKANKS